VLIVCGGGCTDDTGAVVCGFGDARITWLDLPKAPRYGYANRNRARALEQAPGSVIAYMQTDDLWLYDHREPPVAQMLREGTDVVDSRPVHVLADGTLLQHPYDVRFPFYREMLFRGGDKRIPSRAILHARSIVADVGGWNGEILRNGGIEYWQRMLRSEKRFSYLPVPTTLRFTASLRPNAYRDREERERRAYYERIVENPGWVAELRGAAGRGPRAGVHGPGSRTGHPPWP
jgi:hypothetical protein